MVLAASLGEPTEHLEECQQHLSKPHCEFSRAHQYSKYRNTCALKAARLTSTDVQIML